MNPTTRNAPVSSSVVREVARLLWLALGAQILLALASYSPGDPSWSTWSSRSVFHNWMGRAGSVGADVLYQVFGLTAFAIAVLLGSIAFRRQNAPAVRTRVAAAGFFVVALAALLEGVFPPPWLPFHLHSAGGLVGNGLRAGLLFAVGKTGAMIVSSIAFVAAAILLFRFTLVTWTGLLVARAVRAVIAFFRALPGRIRTRAQAIVAAIKGAAQRVKIEPLPAGIAHGALPMPPPLPALAPVPPPQSGVPIGRAAGDDDEELFKLAAAPRRSHAGEPVRSPAKRPRGAGRDYELPPASLLNGRAESKAKPIDREWYIEKGNILVQKLRDFGVDGEVVHISPGPVITVYEFKPASGVKIKEIANLSDDLTLALSVLSVRIVAPIPGKPVVGIEIPSPHRETVFFKDLLQETSFHQSDTRIPIVMGRLASGEPIVAGLASMPHLLVAGSTGTGKSVFINTLICSMLYRYTPQQLKLILVDPKMVELAAYEGIPHLMLPVVVDSKRAALALRWTVEEMERRYSLMHRAGVRHVDGYNEKMAAQPADDVPDDERFLPYIVVVIDEYADLMAVVPKDVELSIARLAQKARASGIHLVLATQRPSTDVVTGTIKANFPSRISFRVASSVDSKTILDRAGADRLLGNGDLLFHSAGFTSLKRMQGAYLSDADLEQVTRFLKEQGEPEYDERCLRFQEEALAEDSPAPEGEDDGASLYDRAVRIVAEKGEASISLIQRHLKIGYNRAADLMEQMERQGVVGPESGTSKRRQVLVGSAG